MPTQLQFKCAGLSFAVRNQFLTSCWKLFPLNWRASSLSLSRECTSATRLLLLFIAVCRDEIPILLSYFVSQSPSLSDRKEASFLKCKICHGDRNYILAHHYATHEIRLLCGWPNGHFAPQIGAWLFSVGFLAISWSCGSVSVRRCMIL